MRRTSDNAQTRATACKLSRDDADIKTLCRQRFGSLKTPKQVEFWPTLPRSPVGKVLKKDVRARLAAVAAPN